MDKPRHPQVIRPWKPERHKEINAAHRPPENGNGSVAKSFTARVAAELVAEFEMVIEGKKMAESTLKCNGESQRVN